MVTAGCDHASCWSIVGTLNSHSNEIELLGVNHVFGIRDIIEYVSDLGVPNSLFIYVHHVDDKNMPDPPMQEDFE